MFGEDLLGSAMRNSMPCSSVLSRATVYMMVPEKADESASNRRQARLVIGLRGVFYLFAVGCIFARRYFAHRYRVRKYPRLSLRCLPGIVFGSIDRLVSATLHALICGVRGHALSIIRLLFNVNWMA